MSLLEIARRVVEEYSPNGTWKGRWEALSALEEAVMSRESEGWEYLVEDFPSDGDPQDLQDWLCDRGRDGWELIAHRSAPVMVDGGYVVDRLVLKRKLKPRRSNQTFLPPVS